MSMWNFVGNEHLVSLLAKSVTKSQISHSSLVGEDLYLPVLLIL